MRNKSLIKILISFFIMIIIIICLFNCIKYFKNDKRDETSLFLGDSITERYKLDKYLFNYRTINSGVGGNTTNDILNDMKKRVNSHHFDKVFLLIGINDLLFTEESNDEIKNNVEKIINNIDNKNAKIYLESVYPINTSITKDIPKDANNKINEFNKILKDVCNNNKCTYINMHDSLTDRNGNLKKIYTNDGIHINKLGYVIVTNKLIKYLNE